MSTSILVLSDNNLLGLHIVAVDQPQHIDPWCHAVCRDAII